MTRRAFLHSRLAKMGYVWEKHFIYPYVMGKPSSEVKALTYWGNITLLFLAIAGMTAAFNAKQKASQRGIGILSLHLFGPYVFNLEGTF